MGAWGYLPFQNDSALNCYGGLHTTKEITELIWKGIRGDHTHCVAPYEICGMILRTFNLVNIIVTDEDIAKVVKDIASSTYNEATDNALYETTEMILCAASIDIKEREKMLRYAMNGLKKVIEENNFEPEFKVLVKPIPGKEYSGVYEWVDGVDDDEESKCIQDIYNLAAETVACNFSNVVNPMQLLPKHIDWLIGANDNYKNSQRLEYIKEKFPKGVYLVESLDCNYVIGKGIPLIDRVYSNFYEKILSKNNNSGITKTAFLDAIVSNFKNGFIINKLDTELYELYSIDYNTLVITVNKSKFFCEIDFLKQLAKCVKIYKSKSEYMAKNKKANANFHAVQKIYGKNRTIVGYTITDGVSVKNVGKDDIKSAIKSGKAIFDNLTLTKDDKLIMTK